MTPSLEDIRSFCSKHAFKMGVAFSDELLSTWVIDANNISNRLTFRSDSCKNKWIKAYVCRECCEAHADGHDRIGVAKRKSYYGLFDDMMRRLEV